MMRSCISLLAEKEGQPTHTVTECSGRFRSRLVCSGRESSQGLVLPAECYYSWSTFTTPGEEPTMQIETFQMERWQSLHEHDVEINLSDSGAHPRSLSDLFEPGEIALEGLALGYSPTRGTPELRRAIAALYPGASADNVLVTNGGAEANFVTIWGLVSAGDEVVVMRPNYGQIEGIVRGLGAEVVPWELRPDWQAGRWRADVDALEERVTDGTKLIAICHPDNPTGARLCPDEIAAIAVIADRHGAWVLVDEIYLGLELDGQETITSWGAGSRWIISNSLSKAYGMPGLRLGWLLGPPETIKELWALRDYTTIAPGSYSDRIASAVLAPEVRSKLLAMNCQALAGTLAIASAWVDEHDFLRAIAPQAGAMFFVEYDAPIGSLELAERLKDEQSVLVVPGAHFNMEGWLRIGIGSPEESLRRGLDRIARVLASTLEKS
ncbi:MAG TPA: aminotransferase class I/II-fold pyridoxal phosphate-dependent enzyme [Planctomycetes bacterium]|nr:aminotransferase class I/II-fold pyridoxal phosphate-dependent enzyme [Planctomycetota bacterium]